MLGLWAFAAWATDLDTRVALYDGLLAEAYGDYDSAVARFTELSRSLPDDDRSLGEALYWLGHGLYMRGRTEEARAALNEGIRTGSCSSCRDLLETLELDESAVTAIPASFDFGSGKNPVLFHPWKVQDRGSIAVAPDPTRPTGEHPDGDPALEWTTTLGSGEPDRLELGLRDPRPAPQTFRFDVRSEAFDAYLDVVAVDVHDHTFALPLPILVSHGTARRIIVALNTLVPTDSAATLNPSQIVTLSIVDRTASPALRSNRIWLDEVEIR